MIALSTRNAFHKCPHALIPCKLNTNKYDSSHAFLQFQKGSRTSTVTVHGRGRTVTASCGQAGIVTSPMAITNRTVPGCTKAAVHGTITIAVQERLVCAKVGIVY